MRGHVLLERFSHSLIASHVAALHNFNSAVLSVFLLEVSCMLLWRTHIPLALHNAARDVLYLAKIFHDVVILAKIFTVLVIQDFYTRPVKEVGVPRHFFFQRSWVVIVGSCGRRFTLSVAASEVALLAVFDTTHT